MFSDGEHLPLVLIGAVMGGSFDGVKAALEAGANVDGHPEQPYAPLVAATFADHADIVQFLLDKGADPDKPVLLELPCPGFSADIPSTIAGERALHVAARSGNIRIVRLLLERARADPNATDNTGRTPLMAACHVSQVSVEVVRLLLGTGADPALANEDRFIPLHYVVLHGYSDLVDMLCSAAPATLNHYASNGETPLYTACAAGHESLVSKLLSLGAMQPTHPDVRRRCPLKKATETGGVGVVQVVLFNEGGIRAVGGEEALATALFAAVRHRQTRVLRLLLEARGENSRCKLANISIQGGKGISLLHYGAGNYYPAAVSILLEAGADEMARDLRGRVPRDAIGLAVEEDDEVRVCRGKEVAVTVAIRRMLQRGPAYRARSWAWPSDDEVAAGGRDDGDTAAAAADAPVPSSPPAVKTPTAVVGVRIFRPKEKSNSHFFVRIVGRYCAKD